jgi:hypothetical protein
MPNHYVAILRIQFSVFCALVILSLFIFLFLYPCKLAGKKILISAPSKLNSSVAYPFALIKPCGGHGNLTLNDINQRIHAPPRSKLKHKVEADVGPYITSAFSGKPVVGRTKIRTEGGRGIITIMRTRG